MGLPRIIIGSSEPRITVTFRSLSFRIRAARAFVLISVVDSFVTARAMSYRHKRVQLDGYEIRDPALSYLGEGTYGTVYSATEKTTGRLVAIKQHHDIVSYRARRRHYVHALSRSRRTSSAFRRASSARRPS